MTDLAILARHIALLADTCSRATVSTCEAIQSLERRIQVLEGQVAGMSVGIRVMDSVPGCVCPPGAEATCRGWGCPRAPSNVTIDPTIQLPHA